jgi:hypothetical protein
VLCASLWQSPFHTTHGVCFTATGTIPHCTLCVLHCDSHHSTLHKVCASLRQSPLHTAHGVCFNMTDTVPRYTLCVAATIIIPHYTICVLHCNSHHSTLHTLCFTTTVTIPHSTLCALHSHLTSCVCFTVIILLVHSLG